MRFRTRPSRKLVIKVMERHITFKFAPSADEPSKGMITEAVSAGFYSSKFWNRDYPRRAPRSHFVGRPCGMLREGERRRLRTAPLSPASL